jgi:protocatechuate 3,4-dioxygenase beta subunit
VPVWDRWDQTNDSGNLVLQLKSGDVPIEGRILNLEGQPVNGAMVRLHHVSDQAKPLNSLGIEGGDLSYLSRQSRPLLPGFVASGGGWIETDPQGKFRIAGVGADRTAVLQIRGPGLAISEIEVATRPQEIESRAFQSYLEVRRTVYGAKFDYTIEPGRVIEGTVRDADTHEPMAGVTVAPSQWTKLAQSVTDAKGHYRIEGLRRKGVFKITAIPRDDQCYFMQDARLADADSAAATTNDFDLHRGVWITGKVTNAATGEPVEGTRINFLPYLSNPYVQKLPEFRHPVSNLEIPGDETRYVSNADGTYRVVAAPGPAIVSAWCVTQSFRHGTGSEAIKGPISKNGGNFDTYGPWASKNHPTAMKEVDIAPDVKQDTRLDFQLDPGISIHLKVVDPQGNPLVGVAASGDRPGFGMDYKKSATFDAIAFAPDERRTLWFWDMPQRLAKTITLKASDAPGGSLPVTLEPLATLTGRLIGPDGLPMANAMVQWAYDSPGAGTDSEGRFKLLVVSGRQPYHLSGIKGRQEFDTDANKIAIKAGETKDLGDVHYKENR